MVLHEQYKHHSQGLFPPNIKNIKNKRYVYVPKIKKILLYEMKISCTKLQLPPEPLTRGLPPPDPSSLCPQLNLLNPPPSNKIPRYATDSNYTTHQSHNNRLVKNETHPHLVPSLRMRGAVPLFPLYAFTPFKGITLPFHFSLRKPHTLPSVCVNYSICCSVNLTCLENADREGQTVLSAPLSQ